MINYQFRYSMIELVQLKTFKQILQGSRTNKNVYGKLLCELE